MSLEYGLKVVCLTIHQLHPSQPVLWTGAATVFHSTFTIRSPLQIGAGQGCNYAVQVILLLSVSIKEVFTILSIIIVSFELDSLFASHHSSANLNFLITLNF